MPLDKSPITCKTEVHCHGSQLYIIKCNKMLMLNNSNSEYNFQQANKIFDSHWKRFLLLYLTKFSKLIFYPNVSVLFVYFSLLLGLIYMCFWQLKLLYEMVNMASESCYLDILNSKLVAPINLVVVVLWLNMFVCSHALEYGRMRGAVLGLIYIVGHSPRLRKLKLSDEMAS